MFDKELFLDICGKYGVKLSDEYKTPMIKDSKGNIRELLSMFDYDKYKEPDFKFLLWDCLNCTGYMKANTLEEVFYKAKKMFNSDENMEMICVFEWKETQIGYRTVESMIIINIDNEFVIKYGDFRTQLHIGWYLTAYDDLEEDNNE